jgi:hypothetical protein
MVGMKYGVDGSSKRNRTSQTLSDDSNNYSEKSHMGTKL